MQDEIRGNFGEPIAKVIFNEPPKNLHITRSVSEFAVDIPIVIRFRKMPEDLKHLRPVIESFIGDVSVSDQNYGGHSVGRVSQPEFRADYHPDGDSAAKVKWTGNLAELAFFEKNRDGGTPRIHLTLRGEVVYFVQPTKAKTPDLRTEAWRFGLDTYIEFSKEIWIELLRKIRFLENVLIEIPLPQSPPSPWDEVWKALVEARTAFENGGSTGWKQCIVSSRLALEKWQGIEKEDMGPGWKSPAVNDRSLRTKSQRLDNIRWHLLQLAHYSAHSHADEWNRQDALLVLSTLSSLLADRNP